MRANVGMHPDNPDAGEGRRMVECLHRMVRADPEFAFFEAGRNIRMGVGINIRIDPQRHPGLRAHGPRHVVEGLQFRGRFHVKEQDAGLERLADFLVVFPHARKDDFVGRDASPESTKQFATRHNVRPAALRRHEPQNGQVRIGFDGKSDEMGNGGEGLVEGLEMADQRGVAVDVTGRALFLVEAFEREVFTVQRIMTIVKIMHLGATLRTVRGSIT